MKFTKVSKIREHILFTILKVEAKNEEFIIDSYDVARYYLTTQRQVRRILSELRKEMIIFLPYKDFKRKKGLYILYQAGKEGHDLMLENYVRMLIKSVKTQYFNDIVKLKKLVRDNTLVNELGQIEAVLEGELK